jgi:hypothetical protein
VSDIDLVAMLDHFEPDLRRHYLEVMARLRDSSRLQEIDDLVTAGRWSEAIAGLDEAAEEMSSEFRSIFFAVALAVQAAIRTLGPFTFDITHWRVQRLFTGLERDLVENFRQSATAAMQDFRRFGARHVRDAVGLSVEQIRRLAAYRVAVTSPSRQRGSDQPARPVDRQVQERLIESFLRQLRAEQAMRLGTWLGQLAIQTGADFTLAQAVEFGALDPGQISREWFTRQDERVRGTHRPMHGQRRAIGVQFETGGGERLMYPGDPNGSDKETRGCRCGLRILLAT